MQEPDLMFLLKHLEKNYYTGNSTLDLEGIKRDPAYLLLLGAVWNRGYDSGFDDGVCDSSVETQTRNPYI